MKNFVRFLLWLFAVATAYAGFEVVNNLCIDGSCITSRGVFSTKLTKRITVGSGQTYTTLKSAIDWINASGGNNEREVLVDGWEQLIADTITLNHTKPVAIIWLWYEVTSLVATGGGDVSGNSMLIVNSPLELNNLMMNGKGIATNWVEVTAPAIDFIQLQNIEIQQVEKWVFLNWEADMRVFNSVIDDTTAYGAYISGGYYRSANCDYTNNPIAVELYAGSGVYFSTEHDTYTINSGQIGIEYQPTTYTNYQDIAVFNNNFITEWTTVIKSGFDFTLERDADIEIYGNIGIEDYRPHAKINLEDYTTGNTYTSNTWSKLLYSTTDIYEKKRDITSTGKITFLPTHMKSAQVRVSASLLTTTSQANVKVGVVKNGNTWTILWKMSVYLDQNNRAFNYSQNIYLDDVQENDYYELYIYPVWANETITLQDMNMYIDSR